jgi:hypothetical protein
MSGRLWHFVERRPVLISLATGIGLVSALLLWAALSLAYSEYWYEPRLKAADPGLYIYPQTRYAVFSAVEILWCTVGLFAAVFSLRDAKSQTISERTKRSLILYAALFAVLLLIGVVMMVVRSYGY